MPYAIEPAGLATFLRWAFALFRRAVAYEIAMWRSLYRWILRRPVALEPGAEAFGYVGAVRMILITFILLSLVEIPIFDLIISRTVPWRPARSIALTLGIYGLVWMIGLLAMMRVHPHILGGSGLRIRSGIAVDVTLPWDAIAAIHARYRSLPSSKGVQAERTESALILNLGVGSQTSVDVVLRLPTVIPLAKGPDEPVTALRFYADDPGALVARARQHLAAKPSNVGLPGHVGVTGKRPHSTH